MTTLVRFCAAPPFRTVAVITRAEILAWTTHRTIALWTILAVEARPRRIAKIPARRTVIAVPLAGVGLARTRIGFFAVGFGGVGFSRIRPPLALGLAAVALSSEVLAGKAALGEFLFRSPGGAGAALAAGRAIAPAAGIVVFVVIAGHEWSLVSLKCGQTDVDGLS